MSHPEHRATIARLIRIACVGAVVGAAPAVAQVPDPNPLAPKANWAAYDRFSTANMRGQTFSLNVQGKWFGETDTLFYSWRDSKGTTWHMVNATTKAKKPLFDHVKLAAQLSALAVKPYEPKMLHDAFNAINVTKNHKSLRFQVDSIRFDWNIATETLTKLGRFRGANSADSMMVKDEEGTDFGVGGGGGGRGGRGGGRGGRGGGGTPGDSTPPDFRNFSPDSTAFVFARSNNLYVWEKASGDTIQITTEGVRDYAFGGGGGRGGQQDDDDDSTETNRGRGGQPAAARNTRPNVTWSGDSKAFFTSRTDQRWVKQLCLVNVVAEPRPASNCYNYAMPAEDSVPRPELWTYTRGEKVAKKAPVLKWKDQQYGVQAFVGKDGSKMRLTRRDRLQRNIEYIELDIAAGTVKVLVSDTKGEAGSLENSQIRYVKYAPPEGAGGGGGRGGGGGGGGAGGNQSTIVPGGDFIVWSEKSGWGHYYLHAFDGTLKRQLTSGDWRADQIVDIDTLRNQIYVRGQGREDGENLYYQHLYRVDLNTSAITLLDPGNYHHTSQLSTNKRFIIDNAARMDSAPKSTLRSTTGAVVMELERADLSRLYAMGWKHVEPFQTLAADGVTPIFGNIWRPFDLDTTKKYPVIAHVYPGPQTESVSNGFSPGGSQMQLAQLGFIVVQIGNRGGTPARSAAYQDFSYFNMRDYALADKKAGIEQLAAKYKYMDIDRVGIYGHSGGGFLTAAALLLPPYNEFFKVGASEAGNHDNNMYNSNWSEQYHGLKWVAASDTARLTAEARAKGRVGGEFSAGQAITAAMNAVGRGGRGGGGRGGQGGGRGGRGGQGGGRAGAATGADGAPAPGTPPDSVFWIYVPTNIDIAANLKGKLLLSTGDVDNNVHPGGTIRLVNALIQNQKRFDLMIYPGQAHSYGPMAPYAWQLQTEYFVEFLLGDNSFRKSADFTQHK